MSLYADDQRPRWVTLIYGPFKLIYGPFELIYGPFKHRWVTAATLLDADTVAMDVSMDGC